LCLLYIIDPLTSDFKLYFTLSSQLQFYGASIIKYIVTIPHKYKHGMLYSEKSMSTYIKLSTIAAGYEQRHEGQQQSQGGGPVRQVVCGGGGHALGAGVRPCVAHHVVDLFQ
jgi:hypothetical protein